MNNITKFFKRMLRYKRDHFMAILLLIISSIAYSSEPFFTRNIIDNIIPQKDVIELIEIIGLFMIVIFVEKISKLFSDYIYSKIGKDFVFDLKMELIETLQKQSGRYFSSMKVGEMNNVINSDVDALEDIATSMLFTAISDIVTSIPVIIYLFVLKWDLFLILVLIYPFTYIIQKVLSKKIEVYSIKARETMEDYVTIINEFLKSPINYLKLGDRSYFFNKFKSTGKRFKEYGIKSDKTYSNYIALASITNYIVLLAILFVGGYGIMENNMTLGIMVVYIQYSSKIVIPILAISQANVRIRQSKESINRIYEVLNLNNNGKCKNVGYKEGISDGKIEIQNLSFSYDKKKVLCNIDIKAQKGEKVAIVGESGSGKSTIINLLYRLWECDSGKILIDGIDIQSYDIDYLRNTISIVSQDIFLFHDTIYNNLILGKNQIDMNEIEKVTKMVGLYDDIVNFESGFDTIIGDNGIKLSGGQKQRLSIARTILKDNPIVIFDEATSALDNYMAMQIECRLVDYFKNKTLIIISHRIESINNADRIYVLKKGMLQESGTYIELVNSNGYFCEIFQI